jgi:hypothetical protein
MTNEDASAAPKTPTDQVRRSADARSAIGGE